MTTKAEIIAAIEAAADAYLAGTPSSEDDEIRRKVVATVLGSAGRRIEIAGQESDSNAGLSPEPTVFATLVEGLADWLVGAGVGNIAAMRAKVNEIIASHNQLIADYNAGTVPTTASTVTLL